MEKLIVIKTRLELKKLRAYLKEQDVIALDTETTGLDKGSLIIGASFCSDEDVGYYVILRSWDIHKQQLIDLETLQEFPAVLQELLGKRLVMYNAVFDCSMMRDNFGVDLMPHVFHDAIISGHLLNENRKNGLKERGAELYGESAIAEKIEMIKSIKANGGQVTKACYELYKADSDLIAKYGAKDAILTLKLFYNDVVELDEQGLSGFFYDDECMPLLRSVTYELNTTGLKVDTNKLEKLKSELEAECFEAKAFIDQEILVSIKDKYPGTSKAKTFNLNSNEQLAWLLFDKLGEPFNVLTDAGRSVCKFLELPVPYTYSAKMDFIEACINAKGQVYQEAGHFNIKTKRRSKKPAKVASPYKYMATGKVTLKKFAERYKWVERLLALKKAEKILNTYVIGIQNRCTYGIIRPSFNQIGTTSGRYSSRAPNFQNLPRDDKRVKGCIIARPGKVFVGADYSQLEPRVFASQSRDKQLRACFANGDDFYSVVGIPIFAPDKKVSLKKGDKDFFRDVCKKEGNHSKVISLAVPYGRTAKQLAVEMGIQVEDAAEIINTYWESWPSVRKMQLKAHAQAKRKGVVYNLFGRPRRIPRATEIEEIYGDTIHECLPYEARTLLNLGVNHEIQSTAASIMNRAAIAFCRKIKEAGITDCYVVLQCHDELIAECKQEDDEQVQAILKDAMENTVVLPGVALIAEPKIARNIADLK